MFYLIYKTVNIIDQKYYIGCHQTDNINDGYLGSGKYLKRAIKKFGRDCFQKEILYVFDSKERMFEKERLLVNESVVRDNLSYNLKIGGSGGNPGIVGAFAGKRHSEVTKEKIRRAHVYTTITQESSDKRRKNSWAKRNPNEQQKHAVAAGRKRAQLYNDPTRGPEVKEKISRSMVGIKQPKSTCPHCNKTGGERLMNRWHFDKCKLQIPGKH